MKKKSIPINKATKPSAFVIAGGSRGLGRETAIQAALLGYPVAIIGRTLSDLEDAKSEILAASEFKVEASTHQCDLTDAKKADLAFKEINRIHGGIRVLMNNAATWIASDSIETTDADSIRKSLDLNFFTAFHASKSALKLRGDSELSVINIGATASLQGWPEVLPFCIGKSALRSFSQALAREYGPKGVHVAHLVIDGLIDNQRTRKLSKGTPKNKYMSMKALAAEIIHVAQQDKSCWTFEWDARPYNENW
jgi:short-subunit dehydrogenase